MDKWTEQSAVNCHGRFKKDHLDCNTELGNDYMEDSEFWDFDRVNDQQYTE